MQQSLQAQRAEMVHLSDMARGFAYMAPDHVTRSLLKAKARDYGRAALALTDAIDGPIPTDIATMDDASLIAALEA